MKTPKFERIGLDWFPQSYVRPRDRRNPLLAWLAYHRARESGEDVPEWVFQLMDGWASEILDLGFARYQGWTRDGELWDLLWEALDFKTGRGQGTAFSDLRYRAEALYAFYVVTHATRRGELPAGAKAHVARELGNASADTVRRRLELARELLTDRDCEDLLKLPLKEFIIQGLLPEKR